MSLIPPRLERLFAHPVLIALAALTVVLLISIPSPSKANVVCSLDSQVSIDFGTSSTATGTVRYTCRSFDPTPTSFNICIGTGNPSYPGTTQQPQMINGANTLAFNLYVDAAATQVWTTTNPISQPVTIAPGAVHSGTLSFYGRIPPGQPAPVGAYQAYFFNTVLGFLSTGAQSCSSTATGLNGLDFTLFVTASVADACNLGAITAIDFGEQDGFLTQIDAAGAVQVLCPANTTWTLTFDGGMNRQGDDRRMRSAGGDYVPYGLFADAARAQPILVGGSVSGVGTGAVQSRPVYGRASMSQPAPPGEYTDAVIVTLVF